jgi:predicted dehydrogenase
MSAKTVRIGIIGGGLMGREMASAFARWCALLDCPVRPELVGVADVRPEALDWFRQIPSVRHLATDHRALLDVAEIEVIYAAVPHAAHEAVYRDVLAAGKDLLAEKPFGADLAAARRILEAVRCSGRFVRCSSEFPFLPGAQRAFEFARQGALGRPLEVVSGFHHSSDLDPQKPANWKRRAADCGEIGVMGDLGMHAAHLPLRLGWRPEAVFAQLTRGFPTRPDGRGGTAVCDTWDNALLHAWAHVAGERIPMRWEMKRLAPGATNTWFFEVLGSDGGVRFSTAEPKTLRVFERHGEQWWKQTALGFQVPFATVTGGIFEPGFPDLMQQMWAAFLLEREGLLGGRFACATPDEACASHAVFEAALRSQGEGRLVPIDFPE